VINVLLVDDSAIIRAILKQIVKDDSRFNIIGESANGQDAITQCKALHPDLVIMDINMPVMNGIEATKIIMAECPTAIVIFSTEDTARYGFEGINAGAIEMISKPDLSSSSSAFYNEFKEKLYLIGSQYKKVKVPSPAVSENRVKVQNNSSVILIGASTGGPQAVQQLLKDFGKNTGLPILLTQHIDANFAQHYAPWLAETTGLDVAFAKNGELCQPDHVYVAPPDFHMTVDYNSTGTGFIIRLNQEETIHFLRPAVDPLFMSGAKNIGKNCIGILLTGMGRDGADGCVQLKKAGAITICESEETCAVFGMPKAAIEEGGACYVLPVNKIASQVRTLLS